MNQASILGRVPSTCNNAGFACVPCSARVLPSTLAWLVSARASWYVRAVLRLKAPKRSATPHRMAVTPKQAEASPLDR